MDKLKEVSIQESKNLKDDTCTVAATSDKKISELVIDEATRDPFQEIQNTRDFMPSADTSSERNTPQLFIEEAQDNEEFKVDGRRVIDFMYFYEELHKIAKHNSPLGCNFSHLQLIKEQKKAKQKSMEEAAKEGYDLAIQNGDLDANGVPMITRKQQYRRSIAKFVGGKRINYSSRQSYLARCATSVVAFNMKQPTINLYDKVIHKKPNTILMRRLELKKKKMRPKSKPSRNITLQKPENNIDKDYEVERNDLERRTVLQSDSTEWVQERRQRLTASSFGKVCKEGLVKCGPLVKNLLRGANLENVKYIQHDKDHENIALEQLTVFFSSIDGYAEREYNRLYPAITTLTENESGVVVEVSPSEPEPESFEIQLGKAIKGIETNEEASAVALSKSIVKKELLLFEQTGKRSPNLESMYKALLSVKPTTTKNERVFSISGNIVNKIRNHLSDEATNALVFLKTYFIRQSKLT
ncbi:unnamed protein product [Arctia plantaginis]|uniref:HAT C-terminal dimerisation domain-containing protein n=1 Tax=Arctia plantaginis TaxID=874455 RepID=A0A8S0ZJG8_ARCPL|nr:unnamed protein product [Arctia plantaginis]